ncbi:unnamed protein product [Adineta steineri]|uniref:Membrane protein BRI3 n=1 Tax=Adineta steineri TaxID=433720 RepID=A0A813MAH5_9BILA|nr:unnamed protein product [Adineta steineri]CAF3613122.1 unnamed protein product [Adineta steineri]
MASNILPDQKKLIIDENNSPSSYQDPHNLGTDSYGTFPGGLPPTTTTTVSSYPYALGSQQPTVIVLGGCPACKIGMLETDFTFLGLCCAIFFFPIGIICCLALRQRRCNFCGSIFD